MHQEGKILLDAGMSDRGWSWRSDVLRCPHRAALKMAGYRGEGRDALIRGSLFHVGIAHYYAQMQYGQMGLDPSELYDPTGAVDAYIVKNPEAEEFRPVVLNALDAYENEYAHEQVEVYAVEELIEMDIVGPSTKKTYRHTARVDLMIQDSAGRIWAWDHKSAGRIDDKKRPGFELSGQVIGLSWWGRKTFGDQWGGFIVNMVEWANDGGEVRFVDPGARTTGRGHATRFLRFQPRLAPYATKMFPMTIEHSEEYLLWCVDRYGSDPDDWPPVLQEQGPCMDRYGACEFRNACRWGVGTNLSDLGDR